MTQLFVSQAENRCYGAADCKARGQWPCSLISGGREVCVCGGGGVLGPVILLTCWVVILEYMFSMSTNANGNASCAGRLIVHVCMK